MIKSQLISTRRHAHFALRTIVINFISFYKENNTQIVELFCQHVYHEECWKNWVKMQRRDFKCPVCNRPLTKNERDKEI
jgi:hypothetical protein